METTRRESSFANLLIGVLCILLALPLFIILHKQLPDPDWPYSSDRIILFILVVLVLLLILRVFRILIIVGLVAAIGLLAYGTYKGRYGFNDLALDYRAMLYTMKDDPVFSGLLMPGDMSFPHRSEFMAAMDDSNPVVRDFALKAINENFKEEQQRYYEYRTLIQCFAIFKKINTNWNYVSDSRSREYFAKASESVKLMAGDCDDHSILMAAAIQSVGGEPRLIHTTGHVYPELLIGNKHDLEQINYLVKQKLFPQESNGQSINYHVDEQGKIWLNLDYTAKYPGGPFMNEKVLNVMTW
jgi:Gamma-aminobutyrate permease and related permeases